jgi:hypothetical protein
MPKGEPGGLFQDCDRTYPCEGVSDGGSTRCGHRSAVRRAGSMVAAAGAVAVLVAAPAAGRAVDTRLSYQVLPSEVGTVAVDGSGYANDGVLKGGVSRRHGVYKFHRVSRDHRYDRIRAHDDESLSPGPASFTYSVRMKVSPQAEWSHSEMAVLRHGDSDTPGGDYKMELAKNPDTGVVSANCVMHDDDGKGAGYVRGTGPLTSIADGDWHTIACNRVAADDTVSLTIDGHTTVRQTHGDLGNVMGQAPLLIGCQLAGDRVHRREQFVGKMDDITITATVP